MKKIRVLHILDELNTGGAERIVTSYFENIDRNRFQWDFIITRYADEKKIGLLEDRVKELGGTIYRVSRKRENYFANIKETDLIIKNGNYDIVHSHLDELSTFYLLSAKRYRVPVRICHSHLAGADRGKGIELFCKFLRPFLRFAVTDKFACGIEAGKTLWGSKDIQNNKVYIMHNAISVEKFKYNLSIRNKMRDRFNLKEKLVIGSVGRLSYQKNSNFILRTFCEIHKNDSDAILVMVGVGEQEKELRNIVSEKHIEKKVKFLGARKDVNELMMMMDVFLLPSRFEGLPIVMVEAQCTGLACVVSDTVTSEIGINSNINYLSLDKGEKYWSERILALYSGNDFVRESGMIAVSSAGYDIKIEAKKLSTYYENAVRS